MGTGIKREYRNVLVINTAVLWIMRVNYSSIALSVFFYKRKINDKSNFELQVATIVH